MELAWNLLIFLAREELPVMEVSRPTLIRFLNQSVLRAILLAVGLARAMSKIRATR